MNEPLLALVLIVPLLSAALCLAAWRVDAVVRFIGVAGMVALLLVGGALLAKVLTQGPVAMQAGSWVAPVGITLVADPLAALMVVLAGVMGTCVAVYAVAGIDADRQRFGFFALLHVMMLGVCGAFTTGDLFNLFVWFEVMLIASFVLLALGGHRQQMAGAIKYVTINLVSSAVFLAGVGIIYGTAHTLNMADLHLTLRAIASRSDAAAALVTALGMLFLVCFGIKSALAGLFFWLPASYATPPAAISAAFAGLLTKVGVYSLIRAYTLIFPMESGFFTLILVIAGFTMVLGVLGAVAQFEIRWILSFHSISQIGYMMMALGLLASDDPAVRRLAIAAAVLYMIHHSIVKSNLFLIGGLVHRLRGTFDLGPLGGLVHAAPWLAVLFLITALSLAGIPPLSGFWAKLAVVRAGLEAASWWVVLAALATGVCTLISMIKIWNEVFWKPAPATETVSPRAPATAWMLTPVVALTTLTLGLGLFPETLLQACFAAADTVLDPRPYMDAVNLQTLETAVRPEGSP